MMLPSRLILKSGEVFPGVSPEWQQNDFFGEVVFTTGMTGYIESLTDPSIFSSAIMQSLRKSPAQISSRSPQKRCSANTRQNPSKPLSSVMSASKPPQFSHKRLKGADPVASVEMASTGEVAHIGDSYHEAFFASWLSTEQKLKGKRLLVSASEEYRAKLFASLLALENQGWDLYATKGTHPFLTSCGIRSISVYKVGESYEPNDATLLASQKVDRIINLPRPQNQNEAGRQIRRLAIDHQIPLITNPQLAHIFLHCLAELDQSRSLLLEGIGTLVGLIA